MTHQAFRTEKPSEKNFGITFGLFFLAVALYFVWYKEKIALLFFILSGTCLILAYVAPAALTLLNRLWFRLGMFLGRLISPVIMGLVFFGTVVPIGLIMRLSGKDLIQRQLDPSARSYWIERKQPPGSMKNQF